MSFLGSGAATMVIGGNAAGQVRLGYSNSLLYSGKDYVQLLSSIREQLRSPTGYYFPLLLTGNGPGHLSVVREVEHWGTERERIRRWYRLKN